MPCPRCTAAYDSRGSLFTDEYDTRGSLFTGAALGGEGEENIPPWLLPAEPMLLDAGLVRSGLESGVVRVVDLWMLCEGVVIADWLCTLCRLCAGEE